MLCCAAGSFHLLHLMFDDYVLYRIEALHSQERVSDFLRLVRGTTRRVSVCVCVVCVCVCVCVCVYSGGGGRAGRSGTDGVRSRTVGRGRGRLRWRFRTVRQM